MKAVTLIDRWRCRRWFRDGTHPLGIHLRVCPGCDRRLARIDRKVAADA